MVPRNVGAGGAANEICCGSIGEEFACKILGPGSGANFASMKAVLHGREEVDIKVGVEVGAIVGIGVGAGTGT